MGGVDDVSGPAELLSIDGVGSVITEAGFGGAAGLSDVVAGALRISGRGGAFVADVCDAVIRDGGVPCD